MTDNFIEAEDLRKRFGSTQALDGLSLAAPAGSVLGVLGPNGAGKTTAVRILTTLAAPDSGRASVAGLDVVADATEVKRRIGLTGQAATVDEVLTGRQNLVMIGRLSGLSRRAARDRAGALLIEFDLEAAGGRPAKTYSGGMRRRLDLAASLVTQPRVLFLDEPTTGLDPTSRVRMWDVIRGLIGDGVTLLLTTQYLEEADQLADRIAVVDHGRVIAEGTPAELKRRTGGARLEVVLAQPGAAAATALAPLVDGEIVVAEDRRRLDAPIRMTSGLTTRVVRALDDAGIETDAVEIRQPSLDDVFFSLTGHPAADAPAAASASDPDSAPDREVTVS